eukprot:gene13271-4104_t
MLKRTSKAVLIISTLLNIYSSAEVSLFGAFQSQSGIEKFQNATAKLNMTDKSFYTKWNSSHGLSFVISQMEELRTKIKQSDSSKNIVFSDTQGMQSEMVKELLLIQEDTKTNVSRNKTICYDNGLNGKYQPSGADSLLSVLNKVSFPSSYVSIVVDKTRSGEETLTHLIKKMYDINKNVVTISLLKKPFTKESFESSALTGNDIFLVDSDGVSARQVFDLAEEAGVSGLNDPLKWVLSKRTMDTLSSTCRLPDGKYYGARQEAVIPNEGYIINKVVECQHNTFACRRCSQRRFRVAVAETAPWLMVAELYKLHESNLPCGKSGRLGLRPKLNNSEFVCFYGFAIDILKAVEERMKIVGIIKLSKDGKYGTIDPKTGLADGIVGEIAAGEADFGLDLIEDKTRNKVISFSSPYSVTSFAVAYLQQFSYKEADVFQPFSKQLWLTIVGTIALLVIIVWIWERISPYSQYQVNKRTTNESRAFGLDDSANYIMGTFFTGEIIDQKPKTFGSHVAIIVISFVSILVISAYSANLITFLVVLDEEPLITGLTDEKLIGDSSKLTVGIHGSSVVSGYLASHSNPKVRKLSESRVKHYRQFDMAVKALVNKEVDLILYDYYSIAYTQALDRDCMIKVLRLNDAEMGVGLTFSKTFAWKRRLNLAAIDISNSGKSDDFVQKWFNQQICRSSNIFYSLDIKRMSLLYTHYQCEKAVLSDCIEEIGEERYSNRDDMLDAHNNVPETSRNDSIKK